MTCKNCKHGIRQEEYSWLITKDLAKKMGDPSLEGEVVTEVQEVQCTCCGGLWQNCSNCRD